MSARIKQIQAAMPTSQLFITPMMFLSGALFPLADLPGWLSVATRLNPLTYVVQPMRAAVFDHLAVPAATRAALDPGITWWGWQVPGAIQVLLAAAAAAAVMVAGILAFDRTD